MDTSLNKPSAIVKADVNDPNFRRCFFRNRDRFADGNWNVCKYLDFLKDSGRLRLTVCRRCRQTWNSAGHARERGNGKSGRQSKTEACCCEADKE